MTRSTPAVGSLVRIEYTKWPDQPHYAYNMRVLGEDDHGVWGSCEPGDQVHKADVPHFVRPAALLFLIPRTGCWSASWYPPTEEVREVYIDINSQPIWTDATVSMIDIDFDVLRHRDGTVEVLDEDEFEDHRVAYGYPEELVTFARAAARDTAGLASQPAEPFDQAWRTWYAHLHGEPPPA